MKHIILSLMLITSIFTISQAQGFIGIEAGTHTLNSNFNTEDKGTIYGLKGGSQDNNWRATFAYNYFDSDDSKLSQNIFTVSADYLFTLDSELIRPYIGGSVGYTFFDYSGDEIDNSFCYGIQAGIVFNLDYHFDIDLGAKYTFYSMQGTYPYYYDDYYLEVFDDSVTFSLGLNYKF